MCNTRFWCGNYIQTNSNQFLWKFNSNTVIITNATLTECQTINCYNLIYIFENELTLQISQVCSKDATMFYIYYPY